MERRESGDGFDCTPTHRMWINWLYQIVDIVNILPYEFGRPKNSRLHPLRIVLIPFRPSLSVRTERIAMLELCSV
jgi:hypothetical protein